MDTRPPLKLVVGGVSGSGKSTIGEAVADRLGARFLDADHFHPAANIAKMKAGAALTDADRADWLRVLGEALATFDGPLVLACSALKKSYRDRLREFASSIRFVVLIVGKGELEKRMIQRVDHFMPPALLASQLATLEVDSDVEVVVNEGDFTQVVELVIARATSSQ